MGISITLNPSEMTAAEREWLAASLTNFPQPGAAKKSPAPSTAGAEPLPTAPEALQGTSAPLTSAPTPPVPTPTASAAPSAPVTTLPPVNGVELDSEGLPWDARIHSGSKAKVASGAWKKRKGVDPAEFDAVVAELKAVMSAPAAPSEPNPAQAFGGSEQPANTTIAPPPPPPPAAPAATVPPPPPPAVTAPANPTGLTLTDLFKKSAVAMTKGHITQEEVNQCCRNHGVPMLALLGNRPDLLPAVNAEIDAIINSRAGSQS